MTVVDILFILLYFRCTYQALVDDVLEYRLNRVHWPGASKYYYLEIEQDSFWRKNAIRELPDALEEQESELKRVEEQEKEIRSKNSSSSADSLSEDAASVLPGESGTQDLLATIDSTAKLLQVRNFLKKVYNIYKFVDICCEMMRICRRKYCRGKPILSPTSIFYEQLFLKLLPGIFENFWMRRRRNQTKKNFWNS